MGTKGALHSQFNGVWCSYGVQVELPLVARLHHWCWCTRKLVQVVLLLVDAGGCWLVHQKAGAAFLHVSPNTPLLSLQCSLWWDVKQYN